MSWVHQGPAATCSMAASSMQPQPGPSTLPQRGLERKTKAIKPRVHHATQVPPNATPTLQPHLLQRGHEAAAGGALHRKHRLAVDVAAAGLRLDGG